MGKVKSKNFQKHLKLVQDLKTYIASKQTERKEIFRNIAQHASQEQVALATERVGYKMPQGYLTRVVLIEMYTACMFTRSIASKNPALYTKCFGHKPDSFIMDLAFNECMNWWAENSSPLYCVTKEMTEAFFETDVLCKNGIFKNLNLPFQQFVFALPNGLICPPKTTGIFVDFLLVTCFQKPGTNTQWINLFFIDISGYNWTCGIGIDRNGNADVNNGDTLNAEDSMFCNKIISLVLNLLLLLENPQNPLFSDVLPSEVATDLTRAKGFSKKSEVSPPKYPRWIGKNYRIKRERSRASETCGTHSSPRTHWRRGHWRCIEPGDGKKWKKSKRLWIEPVLINAGVE